MQYFIKTSLQFLTICSFLFGAQAFAQYGYQTNTGSSYQGATKEINKEITKKKTLDQSPKIVSSINPIHQIAKFISGDDKNNSLLINPRASEYDYPIRSNDINKLNKADVIFYVSDNLERTLPQAFASLKSQPKIVQLIKSENIQTLSFQSRVDEDNTDTHIWLSPENAIGIAIEIADTLSKLYPAESKTYQKNLEQFKIDVKNMDNQNKIALFKVRARSFLIDLNSTAYFENYYNMPAAGVIRYSYDQEPTLKDVEKINALIKKERVVCVLGSFQNKSGLTIQIAKNNKAKFALIDIIGNEINYKQNGYTKMMNTLVDDLVKCSASK